MKSKTSDLISRYREAEERQQKEKRLQSQGWVTSRPADTGTYARKPRFWPGKLKLVTVSHTGSALTYNLQGDRDSQGRKLWHELNWTCWFYKWRYLSRL